MKRKLIILLSVCIFCVLMGPHLLVHAENKRVLKIGGDFNYPPYEFVDSEGIYRGLNVDIMRAVALEMGYSIELIPLKWEDAIKELNEGKIDAIQGVSKSYGRENSLRFSNPYSVNEQVIFTLKDTTYISSLGDLKGKKVSVQQGDISQEILKYIKSIEVSSLPTQGEAIKLLADGKVDAFVGNKTTGLFYIQTEKMLNKIKITGETLKSVEYSLATSKDNIELINMFNTGLKKIKRNGIEKEIQKKWFGEPVIYSQDMWRNVTTAIIFIGCVVGGIIGFTLFINRSLKGKIDDRTRELEKVNSVIASNEEKYRRFIEACPDGIFSHRGDNIILFVNDEGRRLLGASSKKSVIGRNLEDFLGDMAYIDEAEFNHLSSKIAFEKTIKRLDGSLVDVEVRKSHINYEGEETILIIITDITERKRLVEALEYDKIKTEFFANISHELRTPLNVILASLQLMETKACKTEDCTFKNDTYKSIESVRHNANRLLKLVNNLIDITKIDSGYVSLNLTNGNIIDAIENTVMAVIEYAHVKNIDVIFDTDTEELIMAYDEDKIERIMLNILSNAVKFSKGTNGKILVDVKNLGDNIEISVKDNGVGIPKDKISLVFERFRQVDTLLTRSSEGSGIGLSLTKALVEMLQGEIKVESEYGKGTKFTVTLPIKVIGADEETENRSLITNKDMVDIEFSDL